MAPSKAFLIHIEVALLLHATFAVTAAAAIPTNATTLSHPDFQHFNIKEAIAETKKQPSKLSQSHELSYNVDEDGDRNDGELKLSYRLKLIHRDKLDISTTSPDHSHRFSQRIRRDVKRVVGLVRHLSGSGASSHGGGGIGLDNYEVEAFGSEVVSGMDQGSGEYFVRIGVGSPPRSQYIVIDSGSDIVWVQCQPCNQCYRQSDPVFDPSESASFLGVSCGSIVCDRLENSGCHSGHCKYEVEYSDGSYTKGTLALETLTIGSTQVRDVAIGCGHMNRGMFVGAAGLLGLGGGSMSFVGQLGGQSGGAFSYCLVSRGTDSNGSLVFGREAMPVGAAWITLVRNPRAPSFYYINLSGLGVGGSQVPISEEIFQLTETGEGGTVIDTGTAVTRLPTAAYGAFRDAFITQTASLPRAPGVSIFDTCYNLSGFVSVRVPTVSFYFSEGPILTLPARNFLIPVDEDGTFCFAFAPAPSPSGLSIIGNIQQEGIQISIDGGNGFLGFGPNVC
ncbi:Protein ASPARTIC PROTEASE IN GUARD CELL 2 [Ancistrocladus abbreviatus]